MGSSGEPFAQLLLRQLQMAGLGTLQVLNIPELRAVAQVVLLCRRDGSMSGPCEALLDILASTGQKLMPINS
jgi:hypothetical protein